MRMHIVVCVPHTPQAGADAERVHRFIALTDESVLEPARDHWSGLMSETAIACTDDDTGTQPCSRFLPSPLSQGECDHAKIASTCEHFPARPGAPSDRLAAGLLDAMAREGLRGAVLWGFRNPTDHTHHFIHQAIHDQLAWAFNHSSDRDLHLCWVDEADFGSAGCSVGKALNQSDPSPLGHSVVIASPKHMYWSSSDPAVMRLQADPESRYIVHEQPPVQLHGLERQGQLLRWIVTGDDGNKPLVDSSDYGMRSALDRLKEGASGCPDSAMFSAESRILLMPWATAVLPSDMDAAVLELELKQKEMALSADSKDAVGTRAATPPRINFVGTVWDENTHEFCEFVAGCNRAGVVVDRYGISSVPSGTCQGGYGGQRARFNDYGGGQVSQNEMIQLGKESLFAPAFQGTQHVVGKYISDRVLTSVGLGQVVATNNPEVVRLFGTTNATIVYAPVGKLCERAKERVRDARAQLSDRIAAVKLVRSKHTYVKRLHDAVWAFSNMTQSSPMRNSKTEIGSPCVQPSLSNSAALIKASAPRAKGIDPAVTDPSAVKLTAQNAEFRVKWARWRSRNSTLLMGNAARSTVSGSCFPSGATVTLASGRRMRLDNLRVGDEVLAVTAEGALLTDTVSIFSLSDPASTGMFITLSTDRAARALSLTEGHRVPTGPRCCSNLLQVLLTVTRQGHMPSL